MRILALSGWGQPHDALSCIAPHGVHVDYAGYGDIPAALAAIAEPGNEWDMVIGWSLGGQLAVRAVAAGCIRTRRLALIATPFRFVAAAPHALGMKRDLYETFHANYRRNPQRTLAKAWDLVAMGDAHAEQVRAQLARQDRRHVLSKDWLRWLDMLEAFGCEGMDFTDFPPVALIHGSADAVVDAAQSRHFAARLPQAKLTVLEGAGHAPHWHDRDTVAQWVREHAYV